MLGALSRAVLPAGHAQLARLLVEIEPLALARVLRPDPGLRVVLLAQLPCASRRGALARSCLASGLLRIAGGLIGDGRQHGTRGVPAGSEQRAKLSNH